MPYDYDAQSILKRLMDGLQSDVNRLQGGFCMDNLLSLIHISEPTRPY